METIKIVLAEDHALMRAGTRHILEQYPDFQVVGEAEDWWFLMPVRLNPLKQFLNNTPFTVQRVG